ncbi:hypothetical protein COY95_05120 [Candidatus Woesearchaeota archaeon CG_4_10_14_0_8_um_filter_47_5]|nr:MAG: hypothetical protein COY95_05120 [Candidatus Woesearchaeota archaeon CG_4_10_14_0_8_um_filter_47_5]
MHSSLQHKSFQSTKMYASPFSYSKKPLQDVQDIPLNEKFLRNLHAFFNQYLGILVLVTAFLFLLLFFRSFTLFLFFLLLDGIVSYLMSVFSISFTDFLLLGILIFSKAGKPSYALLYIALFPVTRLILGKFENRHLLKLPILFITFIFIYLFRETDLVFLTVLAFCFRYLVEYLVDFFFFSNVDIVRIPRRAFHLIVAVALMSVFGKALLLFLA